MKYTICEYTFHYRLSNGLHTWYIRNGCEEVKKIIFLKRIKIKTIKVGEHGLVVRHHTEIDEDTYELLKKYV